MNECRIYIKIKQLNIDCPYKDKEYEKARNDLENFNYKKREYCNQLDQYKEALDNKNDIINKNQEVINILNDKIIQYQIELKMQMIIEYH